MTYLERALERIDRAPPNTFQFHEIPMDRLEALLLGIAIGDALGNTSESMNPETRHKKYGLITGYRKNRYADGRRVGLPSDDTQMSFWLLEHILNEGRLVPQRLAQIFASRQIFGMGLSVAEFRGNFAAWLPWNLAGSPSAGNGAIMRIAPILALQPIESALNLARNATTCAAITHNEPSAISSAVAWANLLGWLATTNEPLTPELMMARFISINRLIEGDTSYQPRGGQLVDKFNGTLSDFIGLTVPQAFELGMGTESFGRVTHSGAYLMETLPSTLFIVCKYLNEPRRAILEAVNNTRDNDTIASLVASAMGAIHGSAAFEQIWIDHLSGRTGNSDDGHVQTLIERAMELAANRKGENRPGKTLTKEAALRAYARMLNRLDASELEPLLAEDFRFTSQWVYSDIEGKSAFLDYIVPQLSTIRGSGKPVWAEMGWLDRELPGPCVVVAQGGKDDLVAVALARVEDGHIKQLDLCFVPSPHEARRNGDYPGVRS